MLRTITEKRNRYGKYYAISTLNLSSTEKRIQCISSTITKGSKKYTLLYSSNMVPISDVFNYINFELSNVSINNVILAINALKLLYEFLEIFNLDIQSLSDNDAHLLLRFLTGTSFQGQLYTLNLNTERSPSTINAYLAVYRSYLSFLGLYDSVLLKKSTMNLKQFDMDNINYKKTDSYNISKRMYSTNTTTPKYISIEEFRVLLHTTRNEGMLMAECILRLMFECGLRIGEVLGLTLEDLVIENNTPYIYLRNRVSDRDFQNAKSCISITIKRQYSNKSYAVENVGYQKVSLTFSLYDKIIDFINYSCTSNRKCFSANYNKHSCADAVVNMSEKNFYIFINSIGNPLSRNMWNKTLRAIFIKSHIHVDNAVRENNLNHRLRHGYAMFMVKYKHVDARTLQTLLRHRSINSVQWYYRPTDQDVLDLKEQFVESMYDFLPELSKR